VFEKHSKFHKFTLTNKSDRINWPAIMARTQSTPPVFLAVGGTN